MISVRVNPIQPACPGSASRHLRRSVLALAVLGGLTGCSAEMATEKLSAGILPPVVNPVTEMNRTLRELPPPANKVPVAVYDYSDQTGQFKPSATTQTLSKAVTQGATSILIKALQDVGDGRWFQVVERERIDNLLKERSIITKMRMTYLGEKGVNPKVLPPLVYAAIIFEGGIIGFDSNVETGGVGARLLGIGGDVKYRMDTITVYLRAVSTKTGEVLGSVTTHKTVASIALQGGAFKYIAVDEILEAEAGVTKNEPDQLAVQQAIEKAVHSIVIQGADQGIWSFEDERAQEALIGAHKTGTPVSAALAKADQKAGQESSNGAKHRARSDRTSPTQTATMPVPEKAPSRAMARSDVGRAEKPDRSLHADEREWTSSIVGVRERHGHRPTSN